MEETNEVLKPSKKIFYKKKIFLYLFTIGMMFITIISSLSCCLFVAYDFYSISKENIQESLFEDLAYRDAHILYNYYYFDELDRLEYYVQNKNMVFEVPDAEYQANDRHSSLFRDSGYEFSIYGYQEAEVDVILSIDTDYTYFDHYALTNQFINIGYGLRYMMWPIVMISAFLSILGTISLVKKKQPSNGILQNIPLEIVFISTFITSIFLSWLVDVSLSTLYNLNITYLYTIGSIILIILTIFVFILFVLVYLAGRIKQEKWWYKSISHWIYRCLQGSYHAIAKNPKKNSFLIKTIVLNILFVLGISIFRYYTFFFFVLLFALFLVTMYIAYMFTTVLESSKQLAAGNLEYHTNTKGLLFEFKNCGNNLNNAMNALTIATNQRLKSEHFKSELITNVSHDIKTPLTSIINYTDLLSKEDLNNEQASEYVTVLQRQSHKLKLLVENLLEASKASTGNIAVNFDDVQIDILIEQAIGEYSSKLTESQLEVVYKENPLDKFVLADAKLLWRVLENILSNICKYSLCNSRVYVSIDQDSDTTTVTFKNISKYPLDMDSSELMERFVRGQLDRHEEGNGLGLSIVRSLVELQNGSFSIDIDGDLFKAIIVLQNNIPA